MSLTERIAVSPRAAEALELSVVIPALNEEKSIAICVEKALRTMEALGVAGEVVVADNGSTDSTVRCAESAGARVVNVGEKGYGAALMGGFAAARGKYIIMGDGDDSYNFEEIEPYLARLRQGDEFVIGNRFKGGFEKGANPFLHRFVGTPALTFLMNVFFRTGVGDTNCGMRGLTREAAERLHLRSPGMEFATEMIIKASVLRLRISEVPCNLYRDKRGRKAHLNTWTDGWRHLRFMLLFTPTWTYMIPGLLLAALGFAGMFGLAMRDAVAPDAWNWLSSRHSFSAMILFVLGAQILEFGLAAQAFGSSRYFDSGSRTLRLLHEHFRLERGVIGGFALAALGGLVFAYLFVSFYWRVFPPLQDPLRLDLAAFAAAAVIIGIQFVYTSFLLSLFQLKVK